VICQVLCCAMPSALLCYAKCSVVLLASKHHQKTNRVELLKQTLRVIVLLSSKTSNCL
jgi:hypothetical protein